MNKATEHSEYVGSVGSYIFGFLSSIVITVTAYFLVINQAFTGWLTTVIIVLLAILQCYVQMVYFLHLDKSNGPRFRLATFLFAVIIIVIIGGGSLWVMHDLDARMMTSPEDMMKYMTKEQGI